MGRVSEQACVGIAKTVAMGATAIRRITNLAAVGGKVRAAFPALAACGAGILLLSACRVLNPSSRRNHAHTDPETGLYNGAYFAQALRDELRRAARLGRPFSIIVADMDAMVSINNSFGDLAGDLALTGTADIIHRSMRSCDVAARLSGGEFAIALPGANTEQALAVAEKIRRQVESTCFSVSTSIQPIDVTLSLGIASYPVHGLTVCEVMHQADLAVYNAKLCGRNRCWVCLPKGYGLDPVLITRPESGLPGDGGVRNPVPRTRRVSDPRITRGDIHPGQDAGDEPPESTIHGYPLS
jgi:two-component system, cell cycle response regulator